MTIYEHLIETCEGFSRGDKPYEPISINLDRRYIAIGNQVIVRNGVILADAWMPENYANAVKEICGYWGISCLDLKGECVPMGIGGKYAECSPKARELRNAAFQMSDTDSHPNVKAHQYRSTIIENFLRSL